jgi:hypothetical protein
MRIIVILKKHWSSTNIFRREPCIFFRESHALINKVNGSCTDIPIRPDLYFSEAARLPGTASPDKKKPRVRRHSGRFGCPVRPVDRPICTHPIHPERARAAFAPGPSSRGTRPGKQRGRRAVCCRARYSSRPHHPIAFPLTRRVRLAPWFLRTRYAAIRRGIIAVAEQRVGSETLALDLTTLTPPGQACLVTDFRVSHPELWTACDVHPSVARYRRYVCRSAEWIAEQHRNASTYFGPPQPHNKPDSKKHMHFGDAKRTMPIWTVYAFSGDTVTISNKEMHLYHTSQEEASSRAGERVMRSRAYRRWLDMARACGTEQLDTIGSLRPEVAPLSRTCWRSSPRIFGHGARSGPVRSIRGSGRAMQIPCASGPRHARGRATRRGHWWKCRIIFSWTIKMSQPDSEGRCFCLWPVVWLFQSFICASSNLEPIWIN